MSSAESLAVIENADVQAKLDAIAGSGACQRGSVILLDFGAIRARLQTRWESKRQIVWSRLEQIIVSHIGRSGIWVRCSDIEYVVSFAEERGLAAQAVSLKIMEAALGHFLGGYEPGDLAIFMVPEISGPEIRAQRIDPLSVTAAQAQGAVRGAAPAAAKPPEVILTGTSERLIFSLDSQAVVEVLSGRRIGTRFSSSLFRSGSPRPMKPSERENLPTQALLQMDLHAATQAVSNVVGGADLSVVIIPLSLSTILSSHARAPIFSVLQGLTAAEAGRLLIEIVGVRDGTPASRLLDATVLVRPFCRVVMSQVVMSRSLLSVLKQTRIQGVTVSAREAGASDQQIAANILAFGQSLNTVSRLKMIVDLPKADFLPICGVADLRYACLTSSV